MMVGPYTGDERKFVAPVPHVLREKAADAIYLLKGTAKGPAHRSHRKVDNFPAVLKAEADTCFELVLMPMFSPV